MTEAHRRAGRPTDNIDAREKLIFHARELFTIMAYDKVSTRLVAQKAGVNVAMIRYYFGNKEGLFETMLRETLSPMQKQMQTLVSNSNEQNFLDLMRTYYREMIKVPQFPRLVAQVMNMPPSETQRKLLEKVFADISKPMQGVIFDKLIDSGVLRKNADPQLCRVSYISLMVFPFMAPPALLAIHGIELSEAFLNRLFEHNIQLMKHGFLDSGDQYEDK
ncbi:MULTISPECIES: TetR/AcrR family transcriptional regulator [Vibrio]|uniref:TetR/AcrR family transcriptional regulator n=1 Tax=Vibrio TaxID=662 RepID=UPI001CDC0BEA|nr:MULTISPECIES: TetR/AcrR family transcriptional regulator [Vibrio]EJL6726483.1 TetR/AcrR family transcriptional regulator [Vibrio alginolyticus]MCA2489824.1 TetR/AcrR family transcriptional regulator [Vibrio alginolyticus]MDW1782609.1 TetR/AcrR family transcriptional regulator [Vibrio sp. Vb2134]MDW2086926.1 TetR/AcrR family transcriptional regulator [Vibrio sp. 2134-1]MDY8148344.1 TetR/AcrR family transcriptional regulator [Vibrio sp. PBL-C16]